jgi:hypothetical protein
MWLGACVGLHDWWGIDEEPATRMNSLCAHLSHFLEMVTLPISY